MMGIRTPDPCNSVTEMDGSCCLIRSDEKDGHCYLSSRLQDLALYSQAN